MQLLLMFWYLLQSTNQHATTAGVLVFALVSMQLLLMFIFLQSASQHATAGVSHAAAADVLVFASVSK